MSGPTILLTRSDRLASVAILAVGLHPPRLADVLRGLLMADATLHLPHPFEVAQDLDSRGRF